MPQHYSSIIIKLDGTLAAVGDNSKGELGFGGIVYTWNDVPGFTGAKQVDIGSNFVLVLKEDGTVGGSGSNEFKTLPEIGSGSSLRKLSSIADIVSIAAGEYQSFLVTSEGKVLAAGDNTWGQLGLGHANAVSVRTEIPNLIDVDKVWASGYQTFFLMKDGSLKSTGANWNGQLGHGDKVSRTVPTTIQGIPKVKYVAPSNSNVVMVLEDGSVMAAGANSQGQLGLGHANEVLQLTPIPNLSGVVQAVAGGTSTVFLLNDGTLKSCGYNVYGNLGDGTTVDKYIPTAVKDITECVQIANGGYHVLALSSDGLIKAFGNNGVYQLGDNTNLQRNTAVNVINNMGQRVSAKGLWSIPPVLKSYPTEVTEIQLDPVSTVGRTGIQGVSVVDSTSVAVDKVSDAAMTDAGGLGAGRLWTAPLNKKATRYGVI